MKSKKLLQKRNLQSKKLRKQHGRGYKGTENPYTLVFHDEHDTTYTINININNGIIEITSLNKKDKDGNTSLMLDIDNYLNEHFTRLCEMDDVSARRTMRQFKVHDDKHGVVREDNTFMSLFICLNKKTDTIEFRKYNPKKESSYNDIILPDETNKVDLGRLDEYYTDFFTINYLKAPKQINGANTTMEFVESYYKDDYPYANFIDSESLVKKSSSSRSRSKTSSDVAHSQEPAKLMPQRAAPHSPPHTIKRHLKPTREAPHSPTQKRKRHLMPTREAPPSPTQTRKGHLMPTREAPTYKKNSKLKRPTNPPVVHK